MGIGLNFNNFFNRFKSRANYHERDVDGVNWYYDDGLFSDQTGIEMSLNHPILTPALLFISKLICQSEIVLEDKITRNKIEDDEFVRLIERPNHLQTRNDFLTEVEFHKLVNGVAVIYKHRAIGFGVDSLYVLDVRKFEGVGNLDTDKILFSSGVKKYLNTWIKYDDGNKKFELQIKDLIFIKDLPIPKNSNIFNPKSRIDGIEQTLINTKDSLIAKNIILKTNGKELITSNQSGVGAFPLDPKEKARIEKLMNKKYGVSFNRVRTIVSQSSLSYKSLHIALRDLGLDESVKTDSSIVFTALHIPKDVYNIDTKKSSYKNYTESMIGFIQNNIQQEADYILQTIYGNLSGKNNVRIRADFNHIPIMKNILKQKYEGIKAKGDALKSLLDAGIPDEIALKECGFDDNITLNINNNE